MRASCAFVNCNLATCWLRKVVLPFDDAVHAKSLCYKTSWAQQAQRVWLAEQGQRARPELQASWAGQERLVCPLLSP